MLPLDRINDVMHGAMLSLYTFTALYFLFVKNRRERPIRVCRATGALMLLMAIQTCLYFVLSIVMGNHELAEEVGLTVVINLLVVPCCVFVLMELTRLHEATLLRVVTHTIVPVSLAIAYLCGMLHRWEGCGAVLNAYVIWMSIYSLYHIYQTIYALRRYRQQLSSIYADVEGRDINWLGRLLVIMIVIAVLFLLLNVVNDKYHITLFYPPCSMILWIAMCWHIDHMKCNDQIETADAEEEPEKCEVSTCSAKEEDQEKERLQLFLDSLNETLLANQLYADEDLTRNTVARLMRTNYKYLTRDLKQATGMTFSAYVTEVRLNEAARLLREINLTVEEILFSCGYQTKSTFYRAFSKKYDCTPLEYRMK